MTITLRAARVNAGLSQKEVAKEIETSEFSVSNWETGKAAIPAKMFRRMCRLYGVSMDDLILPDESN